MSTPSQKEVKVTILKVIELSYHENKGLSAEIFAKSGDFKVSVDQNGKAKLSGYGKYIMVNIGDHLELGAKFKMLNVSGHITETGDVNYKGEMSFGWTTIGVNGGFNIIKFLDICESLLCKTARLRRDRGKFIEEQLKKVGAL